MKQKSWYIRKVIDNATNKKCFLRCSDTPTHLLMIWNKDSPIQAYSLGQLRETKKKCTRNIYWQEAIACVTEAVNICSAIYWKSITSVPKCGLEGGSAVASQHLHWNLSKEMIGMLSLTSVLLEPIRLMYWVIKCHNQLLADKHLKWDNVALSVFYFKAHSWRYQEPCFWGCCIKIVKLLHTLKTCLKNLQLRQNHKICSL